MQLCDERRRERRFPVSGAVYLVGESEDGPFEIRGRLRDVSSHGFGVLLSSRIPPGTVIWCAAPAYSLYERGQICHSAASLLHRCPAGVRFLAAPLPSSD